MRSATLHAALAALALSCAFAPAGSGARADAIADFYKGRTITLYVGSSAGGAYDIYARFLAKYLPQFMPGNPTVVVADMPGAGSRTAAGFVANVAPHDGTALGVIDQALPLQQALGETLQFDTGKLNWIGNMVEAPNVVLTWTASGVTSVDDAKRAEVPLGGAESGSSQQAKLMNAVLGTKFKIIQGYPGARELDSAMERGEIWARTSGWTSVKATRQEWLREKKITILVQIGLEPSPDLPDVPLLMNLASNDGDRALLKLASTSASIGKPVVAGPGVPPDRVAALRAAFDAAVHDPTAVADAHRIHLELLPISGRKLNDIIADMNATPKPIRDKLGSVLGGLFD